MPILDLRSVTPKIGGDYPPPFDEPLEGREMRSLARAADITDFNANHVIVPPGGSSSQRHWHENEDELVVVLSGSGLLVEGGAEHRVRAGDILTFRKGVPDGHKVVNDGREPLVLLAVGLPERSPVHYCDIDLIWRPDVGETTRAGAPYRSRMRPPKTGPAHDVMRDPATFVPARNDAGECALASGHAAGPGR